MPTGIRNKNFLERTLHHQQKKKTTVFCSKEEASFNISEHEKKGWVFIKRGKGEHGNVTLYFEKFFDS